MVWDLQVWLELGESLVVVNRVYGWIEEMVRLKMHGQNTEAVRMAVD